MINWDAIKHKQAPHLLLDLVMLGLALLHLLLLLFDTTYFNLRPFYLKVMPHLVESYDPVKGVQPHRFTQNYLLQAENFFAHCQETNEVSETQQNKLIQLSEQMIDEDPFARARLSGKLEIIKANMRDFTGIESSSRKAFATFWSTGCHKLSQHQSFFNQDIAPYLRMNFWRGIGTNGRPLDYFIFIDLFFITIFLSEFCISWFLAVRRQGREQKILYPLYHWYDLVSCIPLQQLRALRLLRLLAVYFRLVRSEIISLHKTRIYQYVMRYQKIIMEEISDQVAINILSNIQAKTRVGNNRELIEDTLNANRDEIRDVILANLQNLELPTVQERQHELMNMLSELIMESVRATDEYRQMSQIPLANQVLDRLINEARIGRMTEQAVEGFMAAWQEKLASAQMQDILRALIDDLLDLSLKLSLNDRIQQLLKDINIKILEELKENSTRSKVWRSQEQELVFERVVERQRENQSVRATQPLYRHDQHYPD